MRTIAIILALTLASPALADKAAPVLPASSPDSPWTTDELAAGLKQSSLSRFVASGKKIRLHFQVALDPDCAPVSGYDLVITKQPEHGDVDIQPVSDNTYYHKDNPRAKCNDKKYSGLGLFYKAKPGYAGMDGFEFMDISPSGQAREVAVKVKVIGGR